MPENDPPEIGRGENLLVQASAFDAAVEELCIELLTAPSHDHAVIEVTYLHTPVQRVEAWATYRGMIPSNWTIITVNAERDDDGQTDSPLSPAEPTIVSVPGSTDVSMLGTRITEWLNRFDEQTEEITFCFYSISALLQYTDRSLGLKFIDAVTSKTAKADARAHFHVDPQAHEETTHEAIKQYFDMIYSI